MKNLTSLFTFLVLAATAISAEAATPYVEFRQALTEPQLQCMRKCIADGRSKEAIGCATTRKGKKAVKAVVQKHDALAGKLKAINARIDELSNRVGVLGDGPDTSSVAGQLEKLRGELGDVQRQIGEFESKFAGKMELGVLSDEVRRALADIEDLKNVMSPVKFGPIGGVLIVHSTDGTNYAGGLLGVRLGLHLTSDLLVQVDGYGTVSGGNDPFGLGGRLGLGYRFNDTLGMELGLGGAFIGYDEHLRASLAFLAVDVGPTVRYKAVSVSGKLLLGTELDKGKSAFAIGGVVLLGIELPWTGSSEPEQEEAAAIPELPELPELSEQD
jgi:hypothetical protein